MSQPENRKYILKLLAKDRLGLVNQGKSAEDGSPMVERSVPLGSGDNNLDSQTAENFIKWASEFSGISVENLLQMIKGQDARKLD